MANRVEHGKRVTYRDGRTPFSFVVFNGPIYEHNLIISICNAYRGWSAPSRRHLERAGILHKVDVVVDGKPDGTRGVIDASGAKICLAYCRRSPPGALLKAFGLYQLNPAETGTPLEGFFKAIGNTKNISPFHVDGVTVSSYLPDLNTVVDAEFTNDEQRQKVIDALGCRYFPLTPDTIYEVIGNVIGSVNVPAERASPVC